MNKKVFKAMWLSVIAVVVVTVSSCSSDSDFFGLDGLEDFKSTHISTKSGLVDISEYLDMSNYNSGHNISESDLLILTKAEERLSVIMTLNGYEIQQKNGKEVNISEQLYDYIEENYRSLNSLMGYNKNRIPKRQLSRNTEVNSKNDCVAYAIANALNISYNTVDTALKNKYSEYRSGNGLQQGHLEEAMKLFNSSACERSTLYPYAGFNGSENIISLQGGVFGNNGHAVTALKVTKANSGQWNYVWYHDYQSGGGDHYYMIWPESEYNTVPTKDKFNNTVISIYVY